jgi:hypothetical protein
MMSILRRPWLHCRLFSVYARFAICRWAVYPRPLGTQALLACRAKGLVFSSGGALCQGTAPQRGNQRWPPSLHK